MKRRLEVLVGVLFASALMLGGCVVQTDDADADETTQATEVGQGQAQAALVSAPAGNDPTRSNSGTDPGGSSLVKPGAPGMGEPEPQPWKPQPSGPPADPGTPNQKH